MSDTELAKILRAAGSKRNARPVDEQSPPESILCLLGRAPFEYGQVVNLDCGTDAAAPFNVFQTSLLGVFAVGDVRSGSVKRVASAVGEGSVMVQAIHARLGSLRQAEAREPVTI